MANMPPKYRENGVMKDGVFKLKPYQTNIALYNLMSLGGGNSSSS